MMDYPPLFSLLEHVFFVLIEVFLTAACIGFTSASSSLRWAGLLLVALCVRHVLSAYQYHPSYMYWILVFTILAPICFFRYIDLVLLDRWEFESRGPTGKEGSAIDGGPPDKTSVQRPPIEEHGGFWKRLCFGMNVTLSPRRLNTPGQRKNLPLGSHPMPGAGLLGMNFVRTALCWLMIIMWILGLEPRKGHAVSSTNKISLITRWSHTGMQDTAVQCNLTWIIWLTILCIFSCLHGLFGSIAIRSSIDKVEDWPPPSETTSDTSTIRKFWR